MLLVLLWSTAFAGLMFGGMNFARESYLLAAGEVAMTLYSILLLFRLRRAADMASITLMYLLPFFSVMMLALTVPDTSVSIFGWVLLVPILSHLLLGRKLGIALSLLFLILAGVIFWLKFGDSPELMDARSVANMVVLSIVILGCSHAYELSRERSQARLAELARTDFLTGLDNRLGFTEAFERERKRALRDGTGLGLIIMDLDHFKSINDRYGHDGGDEVLCHVASLLSARLRETDVLCRLGGEELGVLLVKSSPRETVQVANMLCEAVAQSTLYHDKEFIRVTTSAGVASLGLDGSDLKALYDKADQRLYQAKNDGRNRVESGSLSVADAVQVQATNA